MKEVKLIVTDEDAKQRLDKYIASSEEELSRSRIQSLIEEGKVLVNGQSGKANYKVKVHDEISLQIEDDREMDVEAEAIPLDIRYEDEDVIVINKPKGMVVHPANGNQHGTLVNALLYHVKDLSGINGVLRPGIVHRIDKDTTGLLIVAKNDMAHASLSKQLQTKSVNRLYYALVHGVIPHDFGTIDAPIGRDVNDRQKMAVTSTNSKDARTHFKVIERFQEYTLVECRLETGRTHQIRVHMQYIGYPVVGDEKYSYRKTMKTNGQLLHAHQLTFVHPRTQQQITVEAPLPEQFETILKELRAKEG
ncbi:RluA family pseudouridine synthase [[Eubacterium] hominis]|uniref:RluA family pseudouridine synthase n=1 Tax=[Eubacterium] hominis TaxID=2764325 RepID=UPI003A4E3781